MNCIKMKPKFLPLMMATTIIAIIIGTNSIMACPRMQCAPIISKCQILDACRCETKLNYTCGLNCAHCLGDLYSECCSCVGVCPKEDESDTSLASHVRVFNTTNLNEELFDLFVEDSDTAVGRWRILREPQLTSTQTTGDFNCTMVFLDSCVDMYKCESSCESMGASGYRWFHIGCCECIGKYCIDFGLNDIRCRDCPEESDQVIDSL